jgi:hypothetical protein
MAHNLEAMTVAQKALLKVVCWAGYLVGHLAAVTVAHSAAHLECLMAHELAAPLVVLLAVQLAAQKEIVLGIL